MTGVDGRRRPGVVRRRVGVVALLALVIAVGGYVPLALLSPLAPAAADVASYAAPAEEAPDLTFPAYGATAVEAIGWDDSLTTSGDERPRPIASISKVVTALVVLDEKPLDGGDGPSLTFGPAEAALVDAYRARNGKVAPMAAGQVLTERQVLEVMLIESANNYAEVLARWAFGSDQAFVDAARSWLDGHGLSSTTLVEPTGLSPQNTSTSTDLIALGRLALADPDVARTVGTATTSVPGIGEISNSNELLGLDGVVGIKTGTLDEAGACLLFAADYTIGGRRVTVVGAMLGGVDHDQLDRDVQAPLASVAEGFRTITLTSRGDAFADYELPWGDEARAVAAEDATVLVWGDETVQASVETDDVGAAPVGTRVGDVTFTVDGERHVVPLELDAGIGEPGAWWRLTHPDEVF
ncbi:D-alanyl-D-alanine carboxypeptidase family protein [Frigoribacterium sp. SL97]|uniref:D-alanyl-D-alanine carboxypeptidase family protein n=1 Tax=Frigoribacterium sp. SL97 TaxID=2994664 RepID=UPI002270A217|nr:D-alanyl-D-alanine carboxypeptidase [Frigoribacterium sp. SL97]WAC50060.1 D-alanyl-D-alanine carboxypeptidase [Frigoribacterium sp. SL97]